jgi:hypothetical protein
MSTRHPVWALTTATITEMLTIRHGEMFWSDDPDVIAHPGFFTDDPSEFVRRDVAPIESATAAPGEKRAGRRG